MRAKGRPVDRLDRLEDAVAHGQPVVEDGDPGVVGVPQSAVDPDLHVSGPSVARLLYVPDATASSRAAFSSVSSHSRSGSEPQVMPAPVPKRSTGRGAGPVDPEGADADGQLAGAPVGVDPADAAAVRAARARSPAPR